MKQAQSPTLQLKKPKTARTRRILKSHEPKIVEDVKHALLICGHRHSQIGKDALRDIQKLKHVYPPASIWVLSRKHLGMAPFEDGGEVHLEKLSQKHDCGLFLMANHTKSKPHNLIFGRFFDHRIYDMIEVGIEKYQSIQSFSSQASLVQGSKPCFVFLGEGFESNAKLKLVKNLFLDFFRGREVEHVRFEGLERLIVVIATSIDRVLFRQYRISPRKQLSGNAGVEDFSEIGPRFDFIMRRTREAPDELKKEAFKKPATRKRKKNVEVDRMENKVGSLYVPSQDPDKIVTARHKGYKRQRRASQASDVDR